MMMHMDRYENSFLATLRLPVSASRRIINSVIFVHGVALFVPWLTGLDFIFKLLLTAVPALGLYGLYYKNRLFLVADRALTLILDSEDDWQILLANGRVHQAVLGRSLFVHPLLTIILLSYAEQRQCFLFTPDNIDADLFRRLRVRLRFKYARS